MYKIIAVDFDGTLCEDKYPDIGPERHEVTDHLIYEQIMGAKVILWTCRQGQELADAVKWCYGHGIQLDAVNANLPEKIAAYGSDPRKIGADEYWDDRNVDLKGWKDEYDRM